MKKRNPIGLFDSGVGGLSVWREIVRQLPRQDTLYVADQTHVPYGNRPLAEVRHFSEQITRFLINRGAVVIVIACNTASAAALYELRDALPEIPFIGMEPAIKPAVKQTQTGVVGVLATPDTFQGKPYHKLMTRFAPQAHILTQVCPSLVDIVENGALDTSQTEDQIRECLSPLLDAGIDQLVLACTHYPFLRPLIERITGPQVQVIDPAAAIARQTARMLKRLKRTSSNDQIGHHTFYTSGDPARFAQTINHLLPSLTQIPHQIRLARWQNGQLESSN